MELEGLAILAMGLSFAGAIVALALRDQRGARRDGTK